VAVTTSPGPTGMAAVSPPDRTTWPARSPSPSAASRRADQATAAAGRPSDAAPDAVVTTLPLCSSTTPTNRGSIPAGAIGAQMTTWLAEVLSATTSAIVNE
jgi:hypothetical protein